MTRYIDQNYQGSGDLSAAFPVWSHASGGTFTLTPAGLISASSPEYHSTVEVPQELSTLELMIDFSIAPPFDFGRNIALFAVNPDTFNTFAGITIYGTDTNGDARIDCGFGPVQFTPSSMPQKVRIVLNPPGADVRVFLGDYAPGQIPLTENTNPGDGTGPLMLYMSGNTQYTGYDVPLVSLKGYLGYTDTPSAQYFWTATTGCTEVSS